MHRGRRCAIVFKVGLADGWRRRQVQAKYLCKLDQGNIPSEDEAKLALGLLQGLCFLTRLQN